MDTQGKHSSNRQIEDLSLKQSITERFDAVVDYFANKPAVVSNGRQLTYKELDSVSDAIAAQILRERQSDSAPVAILADPEINTIAACLGVLKAGKAYVVLDPNYPVDYLQFIYNDSLAEQILVGSEYQALAKSLSPACPVYFSINDRLQHKLKPKPAGPEKNCYILYTSGSTGKPKGVVQTHQLVLHNVKNYKDNLKFTDQDRWTQLFSPCFGEAMNDIFCALLNGCGLYTYSLHNRGLHLLADWIETNAVSIIHTVPTIFRKLIEFQDNSRNSFSSVRFLCLGGESVDYRDFELFKNNFPRTSTLVNSYGSTETKLISQFLFKAAEQLPRDRSFGSRPVKDKYIDIVDDAGNKLMPGQIGEIQVTSRFMARYWRRSDLEESSFTITPSGSRIYRTGDLGKLSEDGLLYHLGRNDNFVKIRGYRVSIGEVETALLSLPGISGAAVVSGKNHTGSGDALLGCFISRNNRLSTRQIRYLLKQKLPTYMIPDQLHRLESFPVTNSGKIDRKQLLAVLIKNSEKKRNFYGRITSWSRDLVKSKYINLEDKSSIKTALTEIWSEILKTEKIGLHDSFFDIGGQSLTAVEMLHEVEKRMGKTLPLSILLERNSIESLSEAIQNHTSSPPSKILHLLNREGKKNPLFMIHAQAGSVLMYKELANEIQDRSVYGVQTALFQGNTNDPESLEELASIYVKEIRSVQPAGPYHLGGICFGGKLALEVAQQLKGSEEPVGLLAVIDSNVGSIEDNSGRDSNQKPVNTLIEKGKDVASRIKKHWGEGQFLPMLVTYVSSKTIYHINNIIWVKNRIRFLHNFLTSYYGTHAFAIKRAEIFHNLLLSRYKVRPYNGRVVLYRSTEFNNIERKQNHLQRWTAVAQSGLDVLILPGEHMTLLHYPFVSALAKDMESKMNQSC